MQAQGGFLGEIGGGLLTDDPGRVQAREEFPDRGPGLACSVEKAAPIAYHCAPSTRASGTGSKSMTKRQPRYNPEEHTRHGDDIYERSVRPQVEAGNRGKIVAIDIDSGAFEVADDVLTASDHLQARSPNAQTWFVRIGHRAVHRFGPRTVPETA